LKRRDLTPLAKRFPKGASPLRRFPAAHFARVSLLPRELVDLGQPYPDVLPMPYLLFSCDYFGTLGDYVEELTRTHERCAATDALFMICAKYPTTSDPRALEDWLERHRLRPNYSVAGYEPRALDEIDRLIAARENIAAQVQGKLL
jgi:hypothetical protein